MNIEKRAFNHIAEAIQKHLPTLLAENYIQKLRDLEDSINKTLLIELDGHFVSIPQIDELNLPTRVTNTFKNLSKKNINNLIDISKLSYEYLKSIKHIGNAFLSVIQPLVIQHIPNTIYHQDWNNIPKD